MSDFLTNLAGRAFGAAPLIQPRPVAIFEPTPGPRPAPWADAAWQPDPAPPVAEIDMAAPAEIPAAAPPAGDPSVWVEYGFMARGWADAPSPPIPTSYVRERGGAPQPGAASDDNPSPSSAPLSFDPLRDQAGLPPPSPAAQRRGDAPQPGAARGDFHRAESPPRETAGEAGSASMAAERPALATATWAGAAGHALAPVERAAAPMEQVIEPEGAAAAAAGPGWRRERLERPPEPSTIAMRQESGLDQIRHEPAYRPAPPAPRPAGSGAERSLEDGGHVPHQIMGESPLSRTRGRGTGGEGRQARPNTVNTAEERNRASGGVEGRRVPAITTNLHVEGVGITPPPPAPHPGEAGGATRARNERPIADAAWGQLERESLAAAHREPAPIAPPPAPEPGRALRVEVRPAPAAERRSAPPAAAPRQVAEAPPAAPPTIQVTIGRIEVRAAPAPPAARPATPAGPALSLDDYLRQRNRGGSR